ncbi:IDO-domain-containing protein [Violaceomyces palustris]|uniref:IDO-domain-containing protein n=1 Tax=Violaceomyces palustris TaxID=1673888 RepID=A0ACD0NNZ4_9BASI|nr:IDO-domain-containing protein [Violaceomyces palustris]
MASPFASTSYLSHPTAPPSGRSTFYPTWPQVDHDAEYHEIPPEHFLAQQRPTNKHQKQAQDEPTIAQRRRSSLVSTISHDSFHSLPSTCLSSSYHSTDNHDTPNQRFHTQSQTQPPQPLAELANAMQMGMPFIPVPSASSNHFLSPTTTSTTSRHNHGLTDTGHAMPDTSTLAAADFDIDVRSGFLPPEAPVEKLGGEHGYHWETALIEAKTLPLMQGGGGVGYSLEKRRAALRWRRSIREMPVLPLSEELSDDVRYARRGHLVLSFLAHFYIHSQPQAETNQSNPRLPGSWRGYFNDEGVKSREERRDREDEEAERLGAFNRTIPAAIAVPWIQLCDKLDLPPVLTYATTVLWNWAYKEPSKGLRADNVRMLETFTGTASEEHFYLVSLLIEMRGVEALDLMRISLDEAFVGDRLAKRRISHYLRRLAVVLKDLTKILHSVREGCDPKIFYWGIRPWFRGGDAAEGDQAPGWHYEGVDPVGVNRVYTGPSAGQSSLIHALDLFLDVDHSRSKARVGAPALVRQRSGPSSSGDSTFMERMQLYMPGHHRNFLTHLKNISFEDDEGDADTGMEILSQSAGQESSSDEGRLADVDVDDETESPDERPREKAHPIRSLALASRLQTSDEGLPAAYDLALESLKELRDEHMRVAYLYIVAQANHSPPELYAPLPEGFTGKTDDEIKADAKAKEMEATSVGHVAGKKDKKSEGKESGSGAKGTGGTDLVSFLRDCRINTTNALITGKSAKLDKDLLRNESAAEASRIDQGLGERGTAPRFDQSEQKTTKRWQEDRAASSGQGADNPVLPPSSQTSTSLAPSSSSPTSALNAGFSKLTLERGEGIETEQEEETDSGKAEQDEPKLRIWAVDISKWDVGSTEEFSGTVDALLFEDEWAKEREKVMRYYRQIDRTRCLAARLLPRLMFSKVFGIPWGSTRFDQTKEGRPFLSHPKPASGKSEAHGGGGIYDFNISHDSDWVVMAFREPRIKPVSEVQGETSVDEVKEEEGIRLGVDVMKISLPRYEKSVKDFAKTMDMAMTHQESNWVLEPVGKESLALEEEEETLKRLFRIWTYKEAFTKNVGTGLGFDFKTVELAFWELERAKSISERNEVGLGEDLDGRHHGVDGWTANDNNTILKVKGVRRPNYSFAEITLDPVASGDQSPSSSSIVVCQGPFQTKSPTDSKIAITKGGETKARVKRQVTQALKQEEALRMGLLNIWQMDRLVEMAREQVRKVKT